MTISKRELVLKIVRSRVVADECYKEYGGNKYAYLAGVYEGVFADLLGISDFDKLLEEVEK